MKDEKGFTLVELLATIAILGILATIAGISVSSILNRGKDESSDIQNELIEGAAKQYAIDECIDTCEVTIDDLIQNGYLDEGKVGSIDTSKPLYIFLNKNNVTINHSNKLKNIMLGENNENVIDKDPDFTTTSTDVGLFVQEGDSTKSNNGDPTYYYRGAVTNNYVSFGTYQKDSKGYKYNGSGIVCCYSYGNKGDSALWRIVRINEDGSIRLISEAIANNTTNNYHYAFNSSGTVSYLESDAKSILENWFDTALNISDSDILLTGNFCNDISGNYVATSLRVDNKKPSFVCPSGANLIQSKVGLLSVDEAMYAGGLYKKDVTNNSSYLSNLSRWYTMSPYSSSGIYMWYSGTTSYITGFSANSESTYAYARAVINISSDAIVTKGNGSKSSPYVIE